jgi:hypothetical protein
MRTGRCRRRSTVRETIRPTADRRWGFAPVPATYSLGELGADRRVVAQEDHQHVGSGDDAQDATRLDAPARRTMRPERP